MLPSIATRLCAVAGRSARRRRGDREALALEKLRREHAEVGLGHGHRKGFGRVGPEDGRITDQGERRAVDLHALVVAVEHDAPVLADTCRIDLDRKAVDRDGDQLGSGAVLLLLVHGKNSVENVRS